MARSTEHIMVRLPDELIFSDILTRIPVKSLLRFRSVSKHWFSVLTTLHFVNLHLTRSLSSPSDNLAFLIITKDNHSSQQHFLSAKDTNGLANHLLTLPNSTKYLRVSENLNGLVCLHCPSGPRGYLLRSHNLRNSWKFFVYICNPATRKLSKLPINFGTPMLPIHISYSFGFCLTKKEHKVLNIRVPSTGNTRTRSVCEIFTLGSESWRKIEAVFPCDFPKRQESLCVNGVLHWIVHSGNIIVAFDLADERFGVIPLPRSSIESHQHCVYVKGIRIERRPYLIQINGLLSVVYYEHVLGKNMMEFWILEDYQNQVWVMETMTFPSPWVDLMCPVPENSIYTGEILLVPHTRLLQRELQGCLVLYLYHLNMRSFRRIEITIQHQIKYVFSYIESMIAVGINE